MTRHINIQSEPIDLPSLLLDLGDEDEVVLLQDGREIGRLLPTGPRGAVEHPPVILPAAEYPDDYELAQ